METEIWGTSTKTSWDVSFSVYFICFTFQRARIRKDAFSVHQIPNEENPLDYENWLYNEPINMLSNYRSDEEIQRALGQGQLIHDCPLANTNTECFLTKTGKKARKSTVIILIQHRTRSTSQCNNKRKRIKKEEIYCPYLQRHNYLCRKS